MTLPVASLCLSSPNHGANAKRKAALRLLQRQGSRPAFGLAFAAGVAKREEVFAPTLGDVYFVCARDPDWFRGSCALRFSPNDLGPSPSLSVKSWRPFCLKVIQTLSAFRQPRPHAERGGVNVYYVFRIHPPGGHKEQEFSPGSCYLVSVTSESSSFMNFYLVVPLLLWGLCGIET